MDAINTTKASRIISKKLIGGHSLEVRYLTLNSSERQSYKVDDQTGYNGKTTLP